MKSKVDSDKVQLEKINKMLKVYYILRNRKFTWRSYIENKVDISGGIRYNTFQEYLLYNK